MKRMTDALPIQRTEFQASLDNDDLATAQTIRKMAKHVRSAISDPEVQHVAFMAIGSASVQDAAGIAAAVWAWLKQNVQFVPDEILLWGWEGIKDERELLISPSVMVR